MGSVSLGFDVNGKRIRKVVYGKTQKEVNEKLDNLKQQRKHGAQSIVGTDTVTAYLQRWLDNDVEVNSEDKTYQEYEGAVRRCGPKVRHAVHRAHKADKAGRRTTARVAGDSETEEIHGEHATPLNQGSKRRT